MGLIPAHAGKTRQDRASYAGSWAHPRSRGENSVMRSFLPVGMGSSPLTRGKHQRRVLPADYRGLIPAHAGKTRSCSSNPPARGAHPRSRGENSSWDHSRTMFRGSSPLTRGKHALATVFATRRGLIPAHAGKTFFSALSAVLIWAHPRSRGENHDGLSGRH